jgi:hypothetical protein
MDFLGCYGCNTGFDSCAPNDYLAPDVEIAPRPGVADAIVTSLGDHAAYTQTPTGPALDGALQHASAWATAHPNDLVAVALVTDGVPSDECTPHDIPSISAIAARALAATPSVPTYVIGVGTELASLDAIAAAGGTDHAFIVDNAMDVSAQLRTTLDAIRLARWGCSFAQPTHEGMLYDPGYVNLEVPPDGAADAGTSGRFVNRVRDVSHCPASGDAWYWDTSTPPRIVLCSAMCERVRANPASSVSVAIGCPTQDAPP